MVATSITLRPKRRRNALVVPSPALGTTQIGVPTVLLVQGQNKVSIASVTAVNTPTNTTALVIPSAVPNGTVLRFVIQITDGANTPISASSIPVTPSKLSGLGTFTASPQPPVSTDAFGRATLDLTFSGVIGPVVIRWFAGAGIITLDYTVTLTPGTPRAVRSTANIPGGVVGQVTQLHVQAKDNFDNLVLVGGGSVAAQVSGANSKVVGFAYSGSNGIYNGSYTPLNTGTDSIAITYDGTTILNSPYSSVVAPAGVAVPYGIYHYYNGTSSVHAAATVNGMDLNIDSTQTGAVIARLNDARTRGIRQILFLAGANHDASSDTFTVKVTNGQPDPNGTATAIFMFSRQKWNDLVDGFNVGSLTDSTTIKGAIQAAGNDGTLISLMTMDEPFGHGSGDLGGGGGNTWGPVGTMVKQGASAWQRWGVTITQAQAATTATTTLHVSGIDIDIPSGTNLCFLPGVGKFARTNSTTLAGATTMQVASVPVALSVGNVAHSNSIDNMCAYLKGIWPTNIAMGVTHDHNAFFPDDHYHVLDVLLDQYSGRFGDVTAYRDEGLALGQRDHHRILFSINIVNGGERVSWWPNLGPNGEPKCPIPPTGGDGVTNNNCRIGDADLENWSKALIQPNASGDAGVGLVYWQWDSTLLTQTIYQTRMGHVSAYIATLPNRNWFRFGT